MKPVYAIKLIRKALGFRRPSAAKPDAKVEMTIETHRVLVLRSQPRLTGLCATCGEFVEMLSPEYAAIGLQIDLRTVFRFVEQNRLHLIEADDGRSFNCHRSFIDVDIAEARALNQRPATRVLKGDQYETHK